MAQTTHRADEQSTSPAVRRVTTLSKILDSSIRVPGTNFTIGIDPILGILPGAGDTVASVISLYIVFEAFRAGVPRSVLGRMVLNVGIDTVIGSVPVFGTVFDMFWKANERNAQLLIDNAEGTTSHGDETSVLSL